MVSRNIEVVAKVYDFSFEWNIPNFDMRKRYLKKLSLPEQCGAGEM